ncbi:MAG: ABC transporter permease [Oscillospiraceae bacterium]|nr:ABC transporter permease [Oscillospiraceae bacterium]
MKKSKISTAYAGLILIFLYAPIFVFIVYSFNGSNSTGVLSGFSLQWYRALLNDAETMNAVKNTFVLAILSSVIATIIGTAAAVGIFNMRKKWVKSSILTVTNIPMMNPEIVTGISMMLLFVFMGSLFKRTDILGFATLIIAHVTFNLPYVILSVLPKLRQTDAHLSEAAEDLGCTPFQSFYKVVLPAIMPGIITGLIMAFTLSIDDFIISHYVNGPSSETLPIRIFAMTKKRVTPDMYALSTIIFFVILALLILINVSQSRGEKKQRSKIHNA